MSEEPELRSKPVNYDLDDLVALSKLVPRRPLHMFRIAAGALVILLLFTTLVEAWSLTGFVDWPALFAGFFVALLLLLFSNRRFRSWLWLRVARRNPLYAPQTFSLTGDGLRVSSPKGMSELPWTTFRDVKCVDDRLFMFLSDRLAYVVPRRAFDSDAGFQAFAAAAQEGWAKRHRL